MNVSPEAQRTLEAWSPGQRQMLAELLEDAASELQRAFLDRAIAAGHTFAEVHAFADELRGMSDAEAFAKCTLDADAPRGYTVNQLLRAEGDPLFAFELKGGHLSPNEADFDPFLTREAPEEVAPPPPAPVRIKSGGRGAVVRDGGAAKIPGQSGVSAIPQAPSVALGPSSPRDFGESPDLPRRALASGSGSGSHLKDAPPGRLMEDVLNELVRHMNLVFREFDVDGDGQLPLEQALEKAGHALRRGLVVPVVLGPNPGQHRRFALIMQMSLAGKNRAFQLYELATQELAWVNEGDLLLRKELPFAAKANRRITRLAIPSSQGGADF